MLTRALVSRLSKAFRERHLFGAVLAGVFGRVSATTATIIFTPLLIATTNLETYGLVYIYSAALAMGTALDLGASFALNREFARLRSISSDHCQAQGILFWLQALQIAMAVLVFVLAWSFSDFLAQHWLSLRSISVTAAAHCLVFIGACLSMQMMLSLYCAGLNGFERQPSINLIQGVGSFALLGGGTIVMMSHPPIIVFFIWQFVGKCIQVVIAKFLLSEQLKGATRSRLTLSRIKEPLSYGLQMAGVSLLSLLLLQFDAILLPHIIGARKFGIYGLAKTLSQGITFVAGPLFQAFFPRMVVLHAAGNAQGERSVVLRFSHLCAAGTASLAMPLIFFAGPALLAWTRRPEVAGEGGIILALLVVAAALNGLYVPAYAAGMAAGRARFLSFRM